jgi:putative ABC transport system permease protein
VQIHFIHQAGLMLALAMGLTAAGLLAAFIPARRAAAVEPMQALRSE